MFSITVEHGDILKHPCDLLVLKHADGFFGVDEQAAEIIGFHSTVPSGKTRVMPGRNLQAKSVAFVGVGPLASFEYPQIRKFGSQAMEVAKKAGKSIKRVCMPIHGPGYGLDEAEAFSSLVAGILDAAAGDDWFAENIETVEIVEISPARVRRFNGILSALFARPANQSSFLGFAEHSYAAAHEALKQVGSHSELKTRLFVAMPFKDEFNDEWEISIQEAANSLEMLCERIDKTAFVGDIATEIKRRIEQYDGLIALLNGANPNVFLELGYAWAKNKPTILLAKDGQELPFDVKGQRCLFYKGIADLRTKLKSELGQLKSSGVLRRT